MGGGAVIQLCHLPALQALPEIQIPFIVDPSEKIANEIYALGFKGEVIKLPFEEFLTLGRWDSRLDAVIVALPNWLHERATCLALEHGLHVLCEKPIALTVDACERICVAEKKSGKKLAVGMIRQRKQGLNVSW